MEDYQIFSVCAEVVLTLAGCVLGVIALCTTSWRVNDQLYFGLFEECTFEPTSCFRINSG